MQDLEALRKVAYERNPEQAQFLLKKLFMQMNFYSSLSIVAEQCYAFIDTFERTYPEEIWARKMLVQIANMGIAPDHSVIGQALTILTAPGMGNFFKALYDICMAMDTQLQAETRIGYLVSSIVNAVMAQLVEAWYGNQPEVWNRVRGNQFDAETGQYTDPEATLIAYQFWTDESIAMLDTQTWLMIADKIEQRLER